MTRRDAEIDAMVNLLEDNIRSQGWDTSVHAASMALQWALGVRGVGTRVLTNLTLTPEPERRTEWIRRGGRPEDWPIR